MCSDKRKRGGVITSGAKISYNCFNCGFKTGWSPSPGIGKKYKELVSKLGVDSKEIHQIQVELLKHSDDLEIEETSDYVYNLSKFNTEQLPESAVVIEDLPKSHPVRQYAVDRGLFGLYPLLYF